MNNDSSRRRWLFALLAGSCLAGLQACSATREPLPGALDIAAQQARLQQLEVFRVSGGIGFYDDEQNFTAKLVWEEGAGRRDVLVIAPLGIGRLRLIEQGGVAQVIRGSREPVAGSDSGQLLASVLGLDTAVPIDAISEWMRGLPGIDATMVVRDDRGRIQSLTWTDATGRRWRAAMSRYKRVDGLELPGLLTARSLDGNLRLALSDWNLAPAASEDAVRDSAPAAPAPDRLGIPGR